MTGKFIRSQEQETRLLDSPSEAGVTAADELFFNLDGWILSTAEDKWRLEVCGVHTSGSQHWVQFTGHGLIQCGLTLRTETLDVADLLSRVDAWLNLFLSPSSPSFPSLSSLPASPLQNSQRS